MKRKLTKLIIMSVSILIVLSGLFCNTILLSEQSAKAEEQTYFLGGIPIGIKSESQYFVIAEFVDVITQNGTFSPAQKNGLKKGDIILSVNGMPVESVVSLSRIAQTSNSLVFSIQRNQQVEEYTVEPTFDIVHQNKKIGIAIRKDISGIGTLTFVRQDGYFGALGHKITDNFGHSSIYKTGEIYPCNIIGYQLPKENQAGELSGKIIVGNGKIGRFSSNSDTGMNGKMNSIPPTLKQITIGKKEEVREGKAYIYTTIDTNLPKIYEIEIIKAVDQSEEKEKGLLLRVTDKELLGKTGGILQGMSGSPILQNNKLIGAVTHVLTNDATLGYGVYIEWMIN